MCIRDRVEANRIALADGPDAKPPWLHIHAAIPEARLRGGNCHVNWASYVEIDKLIARRRVRNTHRLAIYCDRECGRTHLLRNRDGINAGRGVR